MTRKEKMELLLTKVPEEQKVAFVAELREAKEKDAALEILKKYNISLTEKEMDALTLESNELSDEDLDEAAGGCCQKVGSCRSYSCSFLRCGA